MRRILRYSLLISLGGLFVLFSTFAVLRINASQAYRVAFLTFDGNAVTIHAMNPDGDDQRPFFPSENLVFKNAPSWSPGANEIVYIKSDSQDLKAELLRMDIFGNERPVYLSHSVTDATDPVWSPDGGWIVYAVRHPSRQHLQIIDVQTGKTYDVTQPTDNVFHYNPLWSPDSQWLAFVEFQYGQQAIYTANRDGSGLTNVTETAGYTGNNLRDVQWSPDGDWISFIGIEESTASLEIYLLRPNGKEYRQLPAVNGQPANLRWSPDSQWLMFTVVFGDETVYRMHVENGYLEGIPIAANPNQPVTWSPDGKWIYYSQSNDSGNLDLFRSHPDGSGQQQLTSSLLAEYGPEPSPLVDRRWHLWIHGLIIGFGFVTLGRGVYARSRLSGRAGPRSRQ